MSRFLILIACLALDTQSLTHCPRRGSDDPITEKTTQTPCSAPDPQQDKLLKEAEKNGYVTRRVCFWGNVETRDIVFRRAILLNEGDQFSNDYLQRSLKNLSKLKVIYPVRSDNVKAFFNKEDKTIDFVFCLKEREKKKR